MTSSISYGYYNVLPVSQRGATVDDQQLNETSSESTIYAKAQSPPLPPQEAEPKGEPNILPRQNGLMPVMVFPRRKDSKFFQFSLPKHKFQRVQPGTTEGRSSAAPFAFHAPHSYVDNKISNQTEIWCEASYDQNLIPCEISAPLDD